MLGSMDPSVLVSKYCPYFDSIRPKDNFEWFRRGLFAFASVHTTWKKNVDLYAELWDLAWVNSRRELFRRVERSRAGLTNNRTKFIWQFAEDFWKEPMAYRKQDGESWQQFRNRLEKRTLGLGHAKTSFFIELCYFQDAGVICADTHILQAYHLKGNASPGRKKVDALEAHWISACAQHGLPPVVARWAFWDSKQRKKDSRYWSYVLEGRPSKREEFPLQLTLWFTG